MTTLDPDATGSLDGQPSQDEGAHQVWIGADPYDETYCN